ncbi:MAG TPA: mechanosensitive ion channel family protein [Bryobacteraceae bacterium]|nr:mechanosensitive ion channel family protein [Bryobacteraceae bacterium]
MQAIRHLSMNPVVLVLPTVIFAATLAVGWVVRGLALRALRAWTSRSHSRAGSLLTDALRGPIAIWLVILAVHLAVQSSDLPPAAVAWSAKLLLVLWILSLTIMFVRLAGKLVRYYGDQVPGALPVTTLTESLAQIAVVILGIVLLMSSLGLQITPILTALGVGGLAVALALQDTLSNLFAGFYVAVAGQIRLADYIKLNTGEEGYVTDIGWRSTTLRTPGSSLIIVPNSKVAQAIVTNYYLPEKRVGASLQVAVSYKSDPDHIERLLLEVARQAAGEVPDLLADPAPSVMFDPGFGEWSLGFTLSFQITEFTKQTLVRHELRKRILRRFREEGVEIPLPARDVHLHGGETEARPT